MGKEPLQPIDDDLKCLAEAAEVIRQIEGRMSQVIVGQHKVVRALLVAMLCEGHTLLIGVPGLAKTLLVKTLARSLGWQFSRIQFTPDMMPSDIIGMELLQDDAEGQRSLRFVPGPVFSNLILADEINRTPPKTQAALLEAMQELQVTSLGKRYELPRPFMVVATQNPIEQEGTYPLPEAQLDRFMFSLWMDYPGPEDERQIVLDTTSPEQAVVEPVIDIDTMRRYQALVRRVPVTRHMADYAVALVRATRPGSPEAGDTTNRYVRWGAGPRAGQCMVLSAKAMAVMDGEPAVTQEHVRRAAPLVLRHRIITNYEAAADQISPAEVVRRIIEEAESNGY
ncbi:MAG: MoxR family ATPase [Phycisphaeraceae bacterium]